MKKKQLFLWYPYETQDMKLIYKETKMIEGWQNVKTQLKKSKRACLFVKLEHPRSYSILE